jgi:hypothetical protein
VSPSEKGTAPPGRRAEADTTMNQPPRGYTEARTASDLWIPNHRLQPAEAHLRLVMNTLDRDRPGFWLRELRWLHRDRDECACNGCRLDGAA